MKVLQVSASYKPAYIYGGPIVSVFMLSEHLVKAGAFVEVYTTTANGDKELDVAAGQPFQVEGVTVTYFKRLTKDHSHFSPALFKKMWHNCKQFDIIHIHAWWNLVSVFSCLIALLRGIPVIVSPRGTLSPYSFQNRNIGKKWAIHNFLGKFLLNKSNIHVTSEREREAMALLLKPLTINTLPNFIKLPMRKSWPTKRPSATLRLLFFSRIEQKKGLEILFDALTLVKVPFTLSIAGDGDKSYVDFLKNVADKNKLSEKITWLGFQTENKFDLLHDHDLFVLPSHDENFGNSVIESLAVGTPVLISKNVGLEDYVRANNLGWVCDTNPESVGLLINTIAGTESPLLDKIRNYAPDIIYQDFDEDNLAKKYIYLYNKIINNEPI